MTRRAFTLIEMMVVCTVLMIMAALVTPNLVAMKSGQERDEAYQRVLRLAQQGRENAIRDGKTYSLTLTNSGSTLELQQVEDSGSMDRDAMGGTSSSGASGPSLPKIDRTNGQTGNGSGAKGASGGATSPDGGSVALPDGVTTGNVNLDGKTSSASDFDLHFYPDGRSEGGGVEWVEGSTTRNLSITTDGIATLSEGRLPDASDTRWEAGTYEQRSTG